MSDFFDAALGKLLLTAAVLWTVAATAVAWYRPLPEELTEQAAGPVQVELDPALLLPAQGEDWFAPGAGADYLRGRTVFVPEKKIIVFQPVDLDVPPLSPPSPPRLLPENGPPLEKTLGLPRWGQEFPPLIAPKKPKGDKTSGRDSRSPNP